MLRLFGRITRIRARAPPKLRVWNSRFASPCKIPLPPRPTYPAVRNSGPTRRAIPNNLARGQSLCRVVRRLPHNAAPDINPSPNPYSQPLTVDPDSTRGPLPRCFRRTVPLRPSATPGMSVPVRNWDQVQLRVENGARPPASPIHIAAGAWRSSYALRQALDRVSKRCRVLVSLWEPNLWARTPNQFALGNRTPVHCKPARSSNLSQSPARNIRSLW